MKLSEMQFIPRILPEEGKEYKIGDIIFGCFEIVPSDNPLCLTCDLAKSFKGRKMCPCAASDFPFNCLDLKCELKRVYGSSGNWRFE